MNNALFHDGFESSSRVIYTPSQFARQNLMYLQEAGTLQAEKPHSSSRENLASYLFFVVESGSGAIRYEGVRYELSPGDCVFIDCRKHYSHEASADLWKLCWVHFNGLALQGIYDKYIERGGMCCFHPKNTERFVAIARQIHRLAIGGDHIRDMRINESLSSLTTLLMEESWHPERERSANGPKSVAEVRSYIDEHYGEKISLESLADIFYINKYYLSRLFKSRYGMSVGNYITEVRITAAKKKLRFTSESIESIGLSCGLCSLYYFSRVFKKVEQVSPSEYRKKWE